MSQAGALALIMLIWFVMGVLTAMHASSNDRSGLVWFLVVFLTGLIGLGIYLLVTLGSDDGESDHGRTGEPRPVASDD